MSWAQPVTPDDWESKLIDYFLRCGVDGEAQCIRCFEVTPSTLARVFAGSGASADEVEKAFQLYMSRIPDLPRRLELGMIEKSTRRSPGYFSYLVMTLLISSQFDANMKRNEFRYKLKKWLRTEHSFQNLSGVNLMWEALAKWLKQRILEGESYRELILPPRDSWVQIGHTLRLAFPNKADLRVMKEYFDLDPKAASSPKMLIDKFPVVMQRNNVSQALKDSFFEFKNAWLQGRRALFDMPFWHLHQQAAELSFNITTHQVIINMCIEFDNTRCYFCDDNESFSYDTLFNALVAASAENSDNLGKAMRAGLIFFHQTGHGLWRAKPSPDDYSQKLHIAVSNNKNLVQIRKHLGSYVDEGNWIVTTQPLNRASAIDIFRTIRSSSCDDDVIRPQLFDGIRVPGGWLGLPAFLPSIESDTQSYKIYSSQKQDSKTDISVSDGHLVSSEPLSGEFFIEPVIEVGEKMPPWRRCAHFFSRAVAHPKLGESARYQFPLITDWSTSSLKPPNLNFDDPLLWESTNVDCEYLLEAIYASGASGWEEVELVALLKRVADGINIWHIIRCLHHAGLIEPRLRPGWKGRAWTLVKTSLLHICNKRGSLVIVEGATCSIQIENFQKAVTGLGGKSFRRKGISVWSPPVFGAVLVDPVALSQRLGWPLTDVSSLADTTPLSLSLTERTAKLYELSKVWDCRIGRFLPNRPLSKHEASLSLHVHPGGRDHDIYRVIFGRKTTNFLSRTAAIITSCAKNKQQIFEREDQYHLLCLIPDCGLPDALAAGIRRSTLRNGGPMDSGYVYAIDDVSFLWLKSLLPGCVCSHSQDGGDMNHLVSTVRHSGGKKRLIWRNGRITLAPEL